MSEPNLLASFTPEVVNSLLIASITFIAKKGWDLSAELIKLVFSKNKEKLTLEQRVQPTEQQIQVIQNIPDNDLNKIIEYIKSENLASELYKGKITQDDFGKKLINSKIWKDVTSTITTNINNGMFNKTDNNQGTVFNVEKNDGGINNSTHNYHGTVNNFGENSTQNNHYYPESKK